MGGDNPAEDPGGEQQPKKPPVPPPVWGCKPRPPSGILPPSGATPRSMPPPQQPPPPPVAPPPPATRHAPEAAFPASFFLRISAASSVLKDNFWLALIPVVLHLPWVLISLKAFGSSPIHFTTPQVSFEGVPFSAFAWLVTAVAAYIAYLSVACLCIGSQSFLLPIGSLVFLLGFPWVSRRIRRWSEEERDASPAFVGAFTLPAALLGVVLTALYMCAIFRVDILGPFELSPQDIGKAVSVAMFALPMALLFTYLVFTTWSFTVVLSALNLRLNGERLSAEKVGRNVVVSFRPVLANLSLIHAPAILGYGVFLTFMMTSLSPIDNPGFLTLLQVTNWTIVLGTLTLSVLLLPVSFIVVMERTGLRESFRKAMTLYRTRPGDSIGFFTLAVLCMTGVVILKHLLLPISSVKTIGQAHALMLADLGLSLAFSFVMVPAIVTMLRDTREHWAAD